MKTQEFIVSEKLISFFRSQRWYNNYPVVAGIQEGDIIGLYPSGKFGMWLDYRGFHLLIPRSIVASCEKVRNEELG